MSDKIDLLPYPFCNATPELWAGLATCETEGCAIIGRCVPVPAWNTRTASPLPEDKQKALDWWNEFTDGGADPHDETIRALLQTPSVSMEVANALKEIAGGLIKHDGITCGMTTDEMQDIASKALAAYNKFKQGEGNK